MAEICAHTHTKSHKHTRTHTNWPARLPACPPPHAGFVCGLPQARAGAVFEVREEVITDPANFRFQFGVVSRRCATLGTDGVLVHLFTPHKRQRHRRRGLDLLGSSFFFIGCIFVFRCRGQTRPRTSPGQDPSSAAGVPAPAPSSRAAPSPWRSSPSTAALPWPCMSTPTLLRRYS